MRLTQLLLFARRARGDVAASCATLTHVHVLGDGAYDGFIVWAEARDDERVALDITITTTARKGDVVTVIARAYARDPVALVGLPCTLIVENGTPRVELD